MAFNGRHLIIGFASGIEEEERPLPIQPSIYGNFDLVGICFAYVDSPRPARPFGMNFVSTAQGIDIWSRILHLTRAGTIRPVIGRQIEFAEVPSALEDLERAGDHRPHRGAHSSGRRWNPVVVAPSGSGAKVCTVGAGRYVQRGSRWRAISRLGDAVWECADDGGRAVGDPQSAVDVFQMRPHGSLGQPELPGDLNVGATTSDQVQEVPLARGEIGDRAPSTLRIVVGLLEVGAHQREKRPVALGEVGARSAKKEQANGPPRPRIGPGWLGQTHLDVVVESLRPNDLAKEGRRMPLSDGVEVRNLHDGAQI